MWIIIKLFFYFNYNIKKKNKFVSKIDLILFVLEYARYFIVWLKATLHVLSCGAFLYILCHV